MTRKPSAGSYVASYCTKCKLELGHTIIAMAEYKIARIKCRTCGSEHNYRSAERGIKKARVMCAKSPVKREDIMKSFEKRWGALIIKADGADIPYDMCRNYNEGDIVSHPAFGRGVVLKTLEKKVILLFKGGEKALVSGN